MFAWNQLKMKEKREEEKTTFKSSNIETAVTYEYQHKKKKMHKTLKYYYHIGYFTKNSKNCNPFFKVLLLYCWFHNMLFISKCIICFILYKFGLTNGNYN